MYQLSTLITLHHELPLHGLVFYKGNTESLLVSSTFKHVPLVYRCTHTKRHTYLRTIESAQRCAASLIFNDYSFYSSITEMLAKLNWPSLSIAVETMQLKAETMFKIFHHLIDIPLTHLIITYTYHLWSNLMKFQQQTTSNLCTHYS